MNRHLNLKCYLILFFVHLLWSNYVYSESIQAITFGIVPQHSAKKLAKKWIPILDYLSNKSGIEIIFKTAPSIPAFEKRLFKGKYDFSYMNPYHYVTFHENPGYEAFAKEKERSIKGIIVVKKQSAYESIEDFEGATLAFPSPTAFAASILIESAFKRKNIQIISKYVKSHDSVYRAVAKGIYPAGGGVIRTFNNMEEPVKSRLRILFTTQPYTPHAFAYHPRVDKNIVRKLQEELIMMEQDPSGILLLDTVNFEGISAAHDSQWDIVRGLNLNILKNPITEQQ